MKKVIFFGIVAMGLIGCGGTPSIDTDIAQGSTPKVDTKLSLNETVDAHKDVETVPTITEKDTYPAPFIDDEEKKIILEVINAARAEGQDCGKLDSHGIAIKDSEGRYIYDGTNIMAPAKPLTWSDSLYAAGYEHSDDLVQSDTASHSGSGTASDWTGQDMGGRKSTFVDRARNNGYRFVKLGENISMGTHRDTIEKAVDSWLKSPGHCVNLMNPDYTEVGVGHVESTDAYYTHYWTQVLGTPVKQT